ncbi:hypothetical protein [Metabacillus arenae]|uniref:Uncharacterized protein n=1 Tax=Metabacillus arenae TaxID=2771434 RepID=A0A926NBP5_9BACI|nr:hypothetical protein [Metabacillus arenae]MBD1380549.1 hypothetical protein [Metabacillus arenae]
MKKWVAIFSFAVLLVSTLFTNATGAIAQEGQVTKVGTPLHSITILGAGYGKGPNGEEWIYTVAKGSPAVLSVIDSHTGERIYSFQLEGASDAWGLEVLKNGTVYIAGSKNLYRFVPSEEKVEKFALRPNPSP